MEEKYIGFRFEILVIPGDRLKIRPVGEPHHSFIFENAHSLYFGHDYAKVKLPNDEGNLTFISMCDLWVYAGVEPT